MNNSRIPTITMVNNEGKKKTFNVSDRKQWEEKGYYVEGSKPAPAPKKTTKKTTKKWGNDDG